ncbi:methyltransferase type 12 protein, partial [Cylindrospermopsis raciborskii S05]
GFKIIEWRYTGAALNMPNRSLKTNLFRLPRYVVYAVNKDWGTRLLGGETLIVLAE